MSNYRLIYICGLERLIHTTLDLFGLGLVGVPPLDEVGGKVGARTFPETLKRNQFCSFYSVSEVFTD